MEFGDLVNHAHSSFFFKKKESDNECYHLHIEIFSIYDLKLRFHRSLEELLQNAVKNLSEERPMVNPVGYRRCYGDVDNNVFLLNIFHTGQTNSYTIDRPKPQNSKALLLKLNLSHDNEENDKQICNMLQQEIEQYIKLNNIEENDKQICNMLQQEIKQYIQLNKVLRDNIKLSLTRLFEFERLKFNSDQLEKYIQFKNKELSSCTEEELNKQVEKFINPDNYPHYFKNEVCVCLGAEIVKRIGVGAYDKAANKALDSLNPDNSLQTLQVSALAAIGKSAG